MPELASAAVSAFAQLILLAGVPLLGYALYLRFRHHEGTRTALTRAGLRLGERRYLWWSAVLALGLALLVTAIVLVLEPPLEPLMRPGSALHAFSGLGLTGTAIVLALLYGVIQTGLVEEVLFRGLIAGALSRRMSLLRANLVQASIFLLPHLLLLLVAPTLWPILILVFVIGLVLGWLRIRSGSILGPWLIHAASNVAMALSIAAKTAT